MSLHFRYLICIYVLECGLRLSNGWRAVQAVRRLTEVKGAKLWEQEDLQALTSAMGLNSFTCTTSGNISTFSVRKPSLQA